ncbi:MAG TPA: amidohydrolase family protein [Bryobacteraceae bacterium]|nr:amidohydrolase family protein [Bryobacteraceae bacterium]
MTTRRQFLAGSLAAVTAQSRVAAAPRTILEQFRAGERLEGVDIVDAHGHFIQRPDDLFWPRNVELLMSDAERLGIAQVIASHPSAYTAVTADQIRTAHDECERAAAKYGPRLRIYLVFNPRLMETSVAEMRRALAPESPFVGFKLHGGLAQYPSEGPNYQPVYEFAAEHGLPVLLHPWHDLDGIPAVMQKHPRLKLTLAHMGFLPEGLGELLKQFPNLVVDTCGSTASYRLLELLVRTAGAEKVIFGTDATYLTFGPQLAKVAFAHISEDEKRLIFGGNARRIFGDRLGLVR